MLNLFHALAVIVVAEKTKFNKNMYELRYLHTFICEDISPAAHEHF